MNLSTFWTLAYRTIDDSELPLTHHKAAILCAVAFFLVWTTLAGALADRPPPPGFLLLVAMFGGCAALVYFRVQRYLAWRDSGIRMRAARVSLEGFAAGVCVAVALVLAGGEPSVAPAAVIEPSGLQCSACSGP